MANIELTEEELSEIVGEVLARLAKDPAAEHLWQWHARPECGDEPFGRSRRNHLGALLGLMGAAALPGCGGGTSEMDAGDLPCGDDPCAADAGGTDAGDLPCGDDPCAADAGGTDAGGTDAGTDAGPPDSGPEDGGTDAGPVFCADDPCACADDPCAG